MWNKCAYFLIGWTNTDREMGGAMATPFRSLSFNTIAIPHLAQSLTQTQHYLKTELSTRCYRSPLVYVPFLEVTL